MRETDSIGRFRRPILRKFLPFPEWSSFSTAENDYFQAGSSYTEHLKRAFGRGFLHAQPSSQASFAQIQHTADCLIRSLEECDRELIPFRKDLDELDLLHSTFLAERRKLEQIEAVKRSAAAERNLVEVKKRSSNSNEILQAQQEFDGAVKRERECKRAFDRSHSPFQQSRMSYERTSFSCSLSILGRREIRRGKR
jgi:hypothetical protein